MTTAVSPEGPFTNGAIFDLATARIERLVAEFSTEDDRPDGVLLVANPLLLPEAKYQYRTAAGPDALEFALEHFRGDVVCYAVAYGDPTPKHYTTALQKLWLSWVFDLPSEEVPAWGLPFGITPYAGGFPLVRGSSRLVAAYSGLKQEHDREVCEAWTHNVDVNGSSRLAEVRKDVKANVLVPKVIERLEPVHDVGTIRDCLGAVRAAPVMLELNPAAA
jgi:hypothetical protein